MAVNIVAATAREDVTTAVAVAMSRCGVESWTPVTIRMSGAPKPKPARAQKASCLNESPGWIVQRPTMPAVKKRKPRNRGSRIVRKRVLE
jgi:hypothetical protein